MPNKEFPKNSRLYQEYLAEREEILKHKWCKSEKAGQDIGFDRAFLDWIRFHQNKWREVYRQQKQIVS